MASAKSRPSPTVRPTADFDVCADATALYEASKGFGTNEDAIISVLTCRSSLQRQQIIIQYQQSYGKDLVAEMKGELGGHLEDLVVALLTEEYLYLARELHNAIHGLGTDEFTLIEILCTRSNHEIVAIKTCYQNEYGKSLEEDICCDTSGHLERLLVSMCAASRDEETHGGDDLAMDLAEKLYKAGEGKTGTNEVEFNRILATYSYPLLKKVFRCYERAAGHSFLEGIESELSGSIRMGLITLYYTIENRDGYFARALHQAMTGAGTTDGTLIRILVSRCEIDLGAIKNQYHTLFEKTLEETIQAETSGDYRKALVALVVG